MGIVVVPSFGADPVTVTGPTLDAKVDGLATEFNGNIDNDNIKAGAGIALSKIAAGVGVGYTTTFVNGDLSTGVLTITHSIGSKFVTVTVYDNTGAQVIPDSVTPTNTTVCAVSLVSFGTITGTWNIRVTA